MKPTSVFVLIAATLFTAANGLVSNTELAAGPPQHESSLYRQTERVSIKAAVNGLFLTVHADGTVSPRSVTTGVAEHFELHALGGGLIALQSVANGRFLSAASPRSLLVDRESIGDAEMFRWLGGNGALVRLRSETAKSALCADRAGSALMIASRRCPHAWQLLRIQPVPREPAPSFTLTAPAPGSVLLTRTVTFRWEDGGDDHWLAVGTLPGGSDIYASGSLGAATEATVTGLPLNASVLYVQVSRRVGVRVERVTAEYTAPQRKGLAVIVDFSDRRLEDWNGAGIKNADDLSVQLRSMEAHWAWLSRGLEAFRWDIIRIVLPQPAIPGAYLNSVAFRNAAALAARQQIQTAEYDVDGDGIIDSCWLVVSSGDVPIGFGTGGMSSQAGANLFVDGQASASVQAGATGNFNHEVGHTLGLPEMYGRYGTLDSLTIMADSWPVPPQDFAAYERMRLGWVKPQIVSQTTRGVWLPNADETLAAVMIPTGRSYDYFLIEYRRRPASGYGSVGPLFNGLAVYHVLEASSMEQDPPIVKLEPADGSIIPNRPSDPSDFVYPENPVLLRPMVLTSYFSTQEVFRLENVTWRDGGLAFDIVMAGPASATNLLVNPSFETGQVNRPDGWARAGVVTPRSTFVWPSTEAADGQFSAQLQPEPGGQIWWDQQVSRLVSGDTYVVCGSLKGEGIERTSLNRGAGVTGSDRLWGTFDWTRRCGTLIPMTPVERVTCGIDMRESTGPGTLWCDAMSLERLRRAF